MAVAIGGKYVVYRMVSHGVEQNLAGGKILIKGNALGTDL